MTDPSTAESAAESAAESGANPDAEVVDEAAAVAAARGARRGGPKARRVTAEAATAVSDPPASSETVERAAVAQVAAAMTPPGDAPVVENGTVAASLPSVQRSTFAVLDPANTTGAVADLSPYAATSGNRDGFVRAPVDAHELLYPEGCTTPTVRRAWMAGQWVRADVYRAWAEQQPEGADTTPMPPDPALGHGELTRGVLDANASSFSAPVNF